MDVSVQAQARKRPWNLAIGLLFSFALLVPIYQLIDTEMQRPVFTPDSVWMFFALLGAFAFAFGFGIALLLRGAHWVFVTWSQVATVAFMIVAYVGWYRRYLDYVKFAPDPEATNLTPPTASITGFVFVAAIWLGVAYLPLFLRYLVLRMRTRRSPPATPLPMD